ncbi:MAG: hypothetical protein ABSB74_03185 [Tepidisphaeraceae bacterium]
MAAHLTTLMICAVAVADEGFSKSYDKFKDVTTITSPWVSCARNIACQSCFSYAGQTAVAPPDKVLLYVQIDTGGDTSFSGDDVGKLSMIILPGGPKIETPLIEYSAQSETTTHTQVYDNSAVAGTHVFNHEHLNFALPAADFSRIAYSRNVEAEIGNFQFQFPAELLNSFRRIAIMNRIGVSAPAIAAVPGGVIASSTTQPTTMPDEKLAVLKAAYEAAKSACLNRLATTDQYQAAIATLHQAQADRNDAAGADIPAAAKVLLDARTAVHALEQRALDSDTAVAKAKSAMDAAP